jgi:hypothetical protein
MGDLGRLVKTASKNARNPGKLAHPRRRKLLFTVFLVKADDFPVFGVSAAPRSGDSMCCRNGQHKRQEPGYTAANHQSG